MDKIRIVVADDQDIIRRGLAMILDHQEDMSIVGQAADGEAAVDLAGTVKNYVSTIMQKLHANDRTQMVIKAVRQGIVKL